MEKLKTKFNSLSIKYKIFLYLIGFCFVLLMFLWIFQVMLLGRFYGNIRMKQMVNCRQDIETIIRTDGELEKITESANRNQTCVTVLNPNGAVVCTIDVSKSCKIHKMSFIDIYNIAAKTGKMGGELRGVYSEKGPFRPDEIVTNTKPDFGSDKAQSMIYCREVRSGDDVKGYILLDIELSPVQAASDAIRYQLGIITVIMMAFSAVLATLISRRIAKPIEKLARDVQQLATGDYDMSFNASGYEEINRLSRSLTKTAGELGKVEQLRKDFIANVSHDLRTPLTLIGGYAEVMRDIPGENNGENAQMIIDETHRLSSLVNDLLDMSKLDSGREPVNKTEYNLTLSIAKTVERMGEMLKGEDYKIIFDYEDELKITADEKRISQCFYNILINAVNYTGDDKKIFVRQDIFDEIVQISVTDTGEGVDEKEIPYIWERYYKNDKNHKRSVTGTGLGLSIVRSVIKNHNGMCGVYNTADKGACFWFSLPR